MLVDRNLYIHVCLCVCMFVCVYIYITLIIANGMELSAFRVEISAFSQANVLVDK